VNEPIPLPTAIILPKLLPLILDGNSAVRTNLLKLLRLLPPADIADRAESALLYVRAGMTHLAAEIRLDALNILEWLLETAQEEVVACPGGWVKTLKSFMSMLGWASVSGATKWTATSRASFNSGKATKTFPRQLLVLSQFLKMGLVAPSTDDGLGLDRRGANFPVWDMEKHMIPSRSNAYAHLNLFGSTRDEEGEMYIDREDRQRVFHKRFGPTVTKGIENARKEGGEVGRAAAILGKVLSDGMEDFNGVDGDDTP
jgi:pre-rRNA-processing protein IPI1